MTKGLVVIGRVVGTFGLKGFIKVWPETDFPERFDAGNTVWVGSKQYVIRETQWHKKQVRLRLEGISRLAMAEGLIGMDVAADASERPELDENEYMTDDLIGLDVYDTEGRHLGRLEEVLSAPAQDLYRVGDALIPAVREFVKDIDIQARRMVISPIPGMFDDAD